jgi:hypothetical protein
MHEGAQGKPYIASNHLVLCAKPTAKPDCITVPKPNRELDPVNIGRMTICIPLNTLFPLLGLEYSVHLDFSARILSRFRTADMLYRFRADPKDTPPLIDLDRRRKKNCLEEFLEAQSGGSCDVVRRSRCPGLLSREKRI